MSASVRSPPRDVSDLGELDAEHPPEETAGRRYVETVSRRVQDVIRIRAERDGPPCWEPRSPLAPCQSSVVRDEERGTPFEREDDGRTGRVDVDEVLRRPGRDELERTFPLDDCPRLASGEPVVLGARSHLDEVESVLAPRKCDRQRQREAVGTRTVTATERSAA